MINQKIKDILLLLSLQIVAVPLVILSFKIFEPKKLAAIIAASIFILVGFTMIRLTRKWEEYRTHLCYWCIRIHVFIFSVPMLIGRLIFWDREFEDIVYFAVPGPVFHKMSERFYVVMFVCTLIDLGFAFYKSRKN
jgi:hypothetical protein